MRERRVSGERYRLHALVLDDPAKTLSAVERLRRARFDVADVYTPFPVHGLPEAMGIAPTRISYATLAGAVLGVSLGLGFQVWTSVRDWPLDIGGKSYLALPALVPVTFELGVLLAAFASVIALVVLARLKPRGRAPESEPHPAVTDDRFVILVREVDASFDPARFREMAERLEVVEVMENWRVA